MVKLTLQTAKMHFRSNLMIMYDLVEYPRIWSSLLKPQRMGSRSFHDWQVNSKSTFQKVGLKGFVRERVKLKISTWTVTNSKVNVSVYIHEVIENSSFYKAMAISPPPQWSSWFYFKKRNSNFTFGNLNKFKALERLTSRCNIKVLSSLLTLLC